MDVEYFDFNGQAVKVGDIVRYGVEDDAVGTVSEIRDPDGDYNDDTGRGEMIPPRLFVKLDRGGTEWCDGSLDCTPSIFDEFYELEFHFDDIELVESVPPPCPICGSTEPDCEPGCAAVPPRTATRS